MNAKIDDTFGDPSKSEDEKYILTLMADMGLQDIKDLSEKERSAWFNAAKPTYKMKRRAAIKHIYKKIINPSN